MNIKTKRKAAIRTCVNQARDFLSEGATIDSLNRVKKALMNLCAQSHLFPRSDFPVPDKRQKERCFLIHEDDNGDFALYVNSALPTQTYRPHNHGGSWAVIAAVEGEEKHGLYQEVTPDTVKLVNEMVVKPGTAVSMLEDGIHSICAQGDQPLLHLHFYGKSFARQGERTEYDLELGIAEHLVMGELDYIEDAR